MVGVPTKYVLYEINETKAHRQQVSNQEIRKPGIKQENRETLYLTPLNY